jgi:energy-coupling factor transporter ATP-binding protein EcfA2
MRDPVNDPYKQRTIIIGNSGSGKSTLAARVAASANCAAIHLDDIYWEDQRLLRKRSAVPAKLMAAAAAREPCWVIEGVFGWLIDVVAPRATALIWLDLPWSDCETGLLARGPTHAATADEFQDLLVWSGQYWTRQTPSSHSGHARIFNAFPGEKVRLQSRRDVETFARSL